jgi:hypothetical protein
VSPTTAKWRAETDPPRLPIDPLLAPLVEELLDELEELVEPPHVLGLGAGWQWFVWLLHHHPP